MADSDKKQDDIIKKNTKFLKRHFTENMKPEEIDKLIEEGCDFNAKDSAGRTLLGYAVEKKNYEMANKLLQKGADPNLKCSYDDYNFSIFKRMGEKWPKLKETARVIDGFVKPAGLACLGIAVGALLVTSFLPSGPLYLAELVAAFPVIATGSYILTDTSGKRSLIHPQKSPLQVAMERGDKKMMLNLMGYFNTNEKSASKDYQAEQQHTSLQLQRQQQKTEPSKMIHILNRPKTSAPVEPPKVSQQSSANKANSGSKYELNDELNKQAAINITINGKLGR